MKEVKTFVRVFMVGDVIKALRHEGFHRVTVLDVSALSEPYWAVEAGLKPDIGHYTRMVKIEVICRDEDAEAIVRTIRGAAHTGNPGDGLIAVSSVERGISIRTGDEGDAAI